MIKISDILLKRPCKIKLFDESMTPITLKIGVTGHRQFADEEQISRSIDRVLNELESLIKSKLGNFPFTLAVVSSLAEGADRLVVSKVLNWGSTKSNSGNPWLESAIPFNKNDYKNDFCSETSKVEFEELIKASLYVTIIDEFYKKSSDPNDEIKRNNAYKNAGIFVADNCDVLISIWDGNPSRGTGGTAEIVEYAKSTNKLLYIINSINGNTSYYLPPGFKQPGDYIYLKLRDFITYNNENINNTIFKKSVEDLNKKIRDHAQKVGFDDSEIVSDLRKILYSYTRADILAIKYHRLFDWSGLAIYWLTAIAILILSIYAVICPLNHSLLFYEVGILLFALIIWYFSIKKNWQQKWIDYRYLAERLRTAIFYKLLNLPPMVYISPPYFDISINSNDWMTTNYSWAMKNTRTREYPFVKELRDFIDSAWIEDQINFYNQSKQKLIKRYHKMECWGMSFLVVALLVGLIHAFELVQIIDNYLTVAAVFLPGIISAIAGIKALKDYDRISARYSAMHEYLIQVKKRLHIEDDLEYYKEIIKRASKNMLHEHLGWRIVIEFLRPDPS